MSVNPAGDELSTAPVKSTLTVSTILAADPDALAWAQAMRGTHPVLKGSRFTAAESEVGRLGHEDWHVIADRQMDLWWKFRGRKW